MPDLEIQPWAPHTAVEEDDTTIGTLMETPKQDKVFRRASSVITRITKWWGNLVGAHIKELWCAVFGRVAGGVAELQALTSSDVSAGKYARLPSGTIWVCQSADGSGSVWSPQDVSVPEDYGLDATASVNEIKNTLTSAVVQAGYRIRVASGRVWECLDAVAGGGGQSHWFPLDGLWSFADFGGLEGETDGSANSTLFFQVRNQASYWKGGQTEPHPRPVIYFPPGLWCFNNNMPMWRHTTVLVHGTLRLVSQPITLGAFVVAQGESDWTLTGGGIGVIESIAGHGANEGISGNDNLIAIDNTALLGVPPANIQISDITLRGARHWSAWSGTNEITEVGRGGGKGITVQQGANGVQFSNVIIDDCDIGISVEGIVGTSPPDEGSRGVVFSGCLVRGSRYAGFLAIGSDEHWTCECNLAGVTFQDCAGGIAADGSGDNVSDYFGVLTFDRGVNVTGNIKIFNETGQVTLVRGTARDCNLDISASVWGLVDVIDYRTHGGFSERDIVPSGNWWRIYVRAEQQSPDVSGYLVRGSADSPRSNNHHITWRLRQAVNSYLNTWTGTEIDTANLAASNRYRITALGSGASRDWFQDFSTETIRCEGELRHELAGGTTEAFRQIRQAGTQVWREQISAAGTWQFQNLAGNTLISLQSAGNAFFGYTGGNTTLSGNVLFPVLTDATRGTPTAGRVIINSDDNYALQVGDGTNWRQDGVIT